MIRGSTLTLALLAAAPALPAAEPAMSLLNKHCLGCHGPARMAGLDLRQRNAAILGGTRGAAIVPGKPADSLLFQAVARTGDLKMPPGKPALTAAEVGVFKDWIERGAPWDNSSKSTEPSWWSFRKLKPVPVPPVRDAAWSRNPIDAFIRRTLDDKGLHPSPPADRPTLIRRAYFDLHGLPPSPEEISAFVNDPAPDAWEKVVDRLLASPRYGERWGRHWLDVVRYADTGGFETDIYFANAWRYRDYVIKSLNDDKPYDKFVKEQIAGDEIWPDNLDLDGSYYIAPQKLEHLESRIGTGVYTFGPVMHESGLDAAYLRSEWRADAVEVTSAAFLGITLGCARCHDHKFDALTQRDYYRMAAVFAGSEEREIPLVHIMSVFDYRQGYPKWIAVEQLKTAHDRMLAAAKERILARRKAKFPAEAVAAFETPDEKRTAKQKELAIDLEAAARSIGEKEIEAELTPGERDERSKLIEQIGRAFLKAPPRYPTATVLGRAEIIPEVDILERGDHKKKGAKVDPGAPAALGGEEDFGPELRRKALALWMTQPDHPLTARVMVNRIWQGHFGRGLVGTPNDFGRQGDPPSHPELLDWLASEFVKNGWHMKALHRRIMLSEAYRMASAPDAANAKIDPDNRYLWRMNRQRLEAEAIRDSVLSAAGTLNLKAGGPPVMPPLTAEEKAGLKDTSQWPVALDPAEHTRRSVYLYVKRSFRMPLFETFDMPDTSMSCERRNVTTVAPQALALLNNEFLLEEAGRFARRLIGEGGGPEQWTDRAFHLTLGRAPTEGDRKDAQQFFARDSSEAALTRFCLVLFNLSEFLYID